MKRIEKEKHKRIIDEFCSATTLYDLAKLLKLSPRKLSFILYKLDGGVQFQYRTFTISKKNGGTREISSPTTALKEVQRRLNELLKIIYWEKPSVHSYINKRSIITNAHVHKRKKFVFNLDLKDFFPSINFGRVRGLFMAAPYKLPPKVATIIAQIACYDNCLPQGSPCSPIISNMICSKLDSNLQKLAKEEKCFYTRYADDITFSTNVSQFPSNIANNSSGKSEPSERLTQIIENNGFKINTSKIRLESNRSSQTVTGLTTNEFVNVKRKTIRQVHAMLYAWEEHGYECAQEEHYLKYRSKSKKIPNKKDQFKNVILGKINYIKNVRLSNDHIKKNNNKDEIYRKLFKKYYDLLLRESNTPIIRTEGKTDWMHLKAAWSNLSEIPEYKAISLSFFKQKNDLIYGNKTLLQFCNEAKNQKVPYPQKIICVFDSDDFKINKIHKSGHKHWGNNVYSFILPTVNGYKENICIEMFYPEKVLKTEDKLGRRLFLSNEFHKSTGKHKNIKNVVWKKHNKSQIIDSNVYLKNKSIALSKYHFAKNILIGKNGFDKIDFSKFDKIFNIVKEIIDLPIISA